jgi:membrane associated rhomboid family serine protease
VAATASRTCYRHPDRETGVSCSSCGRPICPDCMTPTSVGMRCPECAKQTTKVRSIRSLHADPRVTYVLLAANVIAFLGSGRFGVSGGGGTTLYERGVLFGPLVADGEVWRLVSGGFLHAGLLHILFNMYLLWVLGQQLEGSLGNARFAGLYATGLLGGSLGVMLLSPNAPTVGASGAVFGLMGAMAIMLRNRGMSIMQTDIGFLILMNLGITFLLPGISIGGHLGGLAGGALGAVALDAMDRRRAPHAAQVGVLAALSVAFAVVAYLLASSAS